MLARQTGAEAAGQLPGGEPAPSTDPAASPLAAGERKLVTALFVDIVGSTALIGGPDPEKARLHLRPPLSAMVNTVRRFGGSIHQVLGDGILALFGAPSADEDHALRACKAALAILKSCQGDDGQELQLRMGLNSGEVVIEPYGDDLVAIGQIIHVASRLEALAAAGQICISEETYRLVEGFVEVERVGTHHFKGVRNEIEVCSLVGLTPIRTRWDVRASQGLTPFVGRQLEIESLTRALQRAHSGRGQIAWVIGEPGIGKSRLVHEFINLEITNGWKVLQTGATAHEKGSILLPLRKLVRQWFDLDGKDDKRARVRLRQEILRLDPSLIEVLPAMLALLEYSLDEFDWHHLDPLQRRKRTIEALKLLILHQSEIQQLIVVFEDMHWADAETLACLNHIVGSLGGHRILLVCTSRTSPQHDWDSKSYFTRIRVDPLETSDTARLLQSLLGNHNSLEPLKRLIAEKADATPFFLEETVYGLEASGSLRGKRGEYRLEKAPEGIEISAGVHSLLAARMDQLATAEKHLLQVASVIGSRVPYSLLVVVTNSTSEELDRALEALCWGEFLVDARVLPEREYAFRHALTHEVAYRSLLDEQRKLLHSRIVDAIEKTYPERLQEFAERLADHSHKGEVWSKCIEYAEMAGRKALERSANREAIAYLQKAVQALRHLELDGELERKSIDLRVLLRDPLFQTGKISEVIDYLLEAEQFARSRGDQGRLAQVKICQAHALWLIGRPAKARATGELALAIANRKHDRALAVRTKFQLGLSDLAIGAYGQTIEAMRETVNCLNEGRVFDNYGLDARLAATARGYWIRALAELGRYEEAEALAEKSVHIAKLLDNPFASIFVYVGQGYLYLRQRNWVQAQKAFECARSCCVSGEAWLMVPVVSSFLGAAYARMGGGSEALSLLESSVEECDAMAFMFQQPLRLANLADGYLQENRLAEALERAESALELARKQDEKGSEAYSLVLLGDIYHKLGELESARNSYERAFDLAHSLKMSGLCRQCEAAGLS